jgi:hypothetical protein
MAPPRPFRPITSAPPDTIVEVMFGPSESVTLGRWDSRLQVWVRVGDAEGRRLVQVRGWRPSPSVKDRGRVTCWRPVRAKR